MSVLAQLCIIFTVFLAAEGLSSVLPFTFPAGMLGMVLIFIILCIKLVKPRQLKESTGFLMSNMTMFFIPVCVSIFKYKEELFVSFLPVVLISFFVTPLVFFTAGHAVQLSMKLIERRKNK